MFSYLIVTGCIVYNVYISYIYVLKFFFHFKVTSKKSAIYIFIIIIIYYYYRVCLFEKPFPDYYFDFQLVL